MKKCISLHLSSLEIVLFKTNIGNNTKAEYNASNVLESVGNDTLITDLKKLSDYNELI